MALALLASGLAESFGLAMIIGAYSIGLALSDTHLKEKIERPIMEGLYPALVPVFFVVMGMLVDVSAMGGTIVFSLIITLLAIISKVVGSRATGPCGRLHKGGINAPSASGCFHVERWP